jgi:hypothetical protein
MWTTEIKKCLAALGTLLGSRVFKTRSCITEASADVRVATVHPYNAVLAQLTTPGPGYSGDMTQQDSTTGRAMFSTTE